MKIVVLGPIHRTSIAELFSKYNLSDMPEGYFGAPFLGVLIRAFLDHGHEVVAITTSVCRELNNWRVQEFHAEKFSWIVVPARAHSFRTNHSMSGYVLDCYRYERRLMVDAIQRTAPDIVHAHWSYEFASVAIDSGFPHLVTIHDNHFKVLQYMPNIYRLFRLMLAERNLVKLVTVSTVSPYMREFLKNKVADVQVIPNPIKIHLKIDQINDLITQRIRAISAPQIIMVNNGWKGLKNGLFGLKVFKALLRFNSRFQLHLVGSDSDYGGPAFEDARKLGIESSLHFHGKITNSFLQELLKDMHLLLHTAKEESFGVVLGEAAALGVPAIGYFKAGAVPWVINDVELLYKMWDSDLVASQIISLLFENNLKYKSKCVEVYNKVNADFSVEKVVSEYENYYTKILSCSN